MSRYLLRAYQRMDRVARPVEVFYTGRVNDEQNGSYWVSIHRQDGFLFGAGEAAIKAAQFNTMTPLHGMTFDIVEAQ